MKEYNLLTWKPVIYAANVSEDDLADDGDSNVHVQKVREYAKETGSEVFALCAEIEQEISELEEDEKKEFLEDLGIKQSGLEKADSSKLPSAGTVKLPDCRRGRNKSLDHQGGNQGTAGCRKNPHRF